MLVQIDNLTLGREVAFHAFDLGMDTEQLISVNSASVATMHPNLGHNNNATAVARFLKEL